MLKIKKSPLISKNLPLSLKETFHQASFQEHSVQIYVVENEKVLLIERKRGMGKGLISGAGGKKESGETSAEAAKRELEEETGLITLVSDLKLVGKMWIYWLKDNHFLQGDIFISYNFSGNIQESAEARPFWCAIHEIPFKHMWGDEVLWLKPALKGNFFEAYILNDNGHLKQYFLTWYKN